MGCSAWWPDFIPRIHIKVERVNWFHKVVLTYICHGMCIYPLHNNTHTHIHTYTRTHSTHMLMFVFLPTNASFPFKELVRLPQTLQLFRCVSFPVSLADISTVSSLAELIRFWHLFYKCCFMNIQNSSHQSCKEAFDFRSWWQWFPRWDRCWVTKAPDVANW